MDEAGRGSVMGPLVVGAVFVDSDDALREIGVKDSKKLTPKRREAMFDRITDCSVHWCTVVASSEDIDRLRRDISLNEVELRMFAEAVSSHPFDTLYADCPDINESGFTARLADALGGHSGIIAKHKADDTYPVVSAASIVAKVTRDRMLDDIRAEFGENIGSGYPSDHYTMEFIERWISENGRAPPHVRCSWEPVRQMLSRSKNTKISDW